jgi:hypothetical protein
MKRFSHLWYLVEFFLEWEIFQIKIVEKIKYTFYIQHFFSEKCAIYEIIYENVVGPERSQMATQRRVACWTSETACERPQARTR